MDLIQQLWVGHRLLSIADGSLQRLKIRELRKMIRLLQGNNSILGNLSRPDLNRYINTGRIKDISLQMITSVNNLQQRQRIKTNWINAARYAIRAHTNIKTPKTPPSKLKK